jgi:type VI secretion system protein ImpK
MLVALHREAWGGEKFFEMLDRLLADPARHIDLIELQYLILALGFTGKYDRIARGHEQLTELQRTVYRTIRTQRGAGPSELSLRWRGLEDRRSRLVRYVPWWVVVAAGVAVVAGTFILYYTWLQGQAKPVQKTLAAIGIGPPPPPPPPPDVPTLKKLLRDLIARGVLTVDENGGESVVTLRSTTMFASARATVNSGDRPTLGRIADALNQLPGTVAVVGHTDDQPIKSILFPDNYELSRQRAVEVSRILQERLKDPARVTETRGLGPDKPLDPQNRDRNRRVEIIHRHES